LEFVLYVVTRDFSWLQKRNVPSTFSTKIWTGSWPFQPERALSYDFKIFSTHSHQETLEYKSTVARFKIIKQRINKVEDKGKSTEINVTILSDHKPKSIGHGVSFIRAQKLVHER
jgi:hypothetical protein